MQFMAFLGLAAGFMVLNALLMQYFFSDLTAVLLDKTAVISADMIVQFKLAQLMSAVLSFLVPALLFAYFSSPAALPYVGIRRQISPVLVLAAVALLVIVQPFVGWLGDLNSKINFGSLQKAMEEAEANYTRALQAFLKMKGMGDVLINLFIMALLPAFAEELFFRGALQKSLTRLTKYPAIAILLSTVVFAALHGTIFKMLPIFALGLMLGVIYQVTRNLWYTIIIHFLNNGLAVLAVYFSSKNEFMKKLANDNISITWYAAILSLTVAVLVLVFMHNKSKTELPAHTTDEDNDYIA